MVKKIDTLARNVLAWSGSRILLRSLLLEFGLRDLAEELRNVLFRCQDLVLFTGTQRSQHHVRWDDQYVQYVL